MNDLNNKFLTVDVSLETLKKYCIWSIIKFFKDEYHVQQNSTRNDLLGGFLDRWINRIPESLIFQELLKSEEFDVVNDDFFYIDESAKNAPDVIGLVRCKEDSESSEFESLNKDEFNRFYQFYTFNINQWSKFDDDAPFIEMKTTRSSQKLATIAKRQDNIDENYFVLVESNINDYYLLYLLDKKIFNESYNFNVDGSFFKNDLDIIELPNLAINNEINSLVHKGIISYGDEIESIGDYQLCGIFKGTTIKEFSSEVGLDQEDKPISPRYLKDMDELYKDEKIYDNSFELEYHADAIKSIPILVNVLDNSSIFVEDIYNEGLLVSVEGEIELFELNGNFIEKIPSGFYKFKFETFTSNLYKFYYFDCCEKLEFSSLKLKINRERLDSGILGFYGKEFINNKFDLKTTLFDLNAEIYDCSKSTLVYKCYLESNTNNFEETFCKISFKSSGEVEGIPEEGINPIKKKKILLEYDKDEISHFNLKFDVKDNSKLRFLKKNKSSFIICIDGKAEIYDGVSENPHEIKDNFYKFEIKERSRNKKKYFQLIASDKGDDANPDKECFDDLIVNDKGFFMLDDIDTNVKIKVDLIGNSTIKVIKKMHSKKKYQNGNKKTNYLYISIDGEARINGKKIKDGTNTVFKRIWKLTFDDFERTSKKVEYVLSKDAIMYSDVSCEDELIECFRNYIKKFDNML